VEEEHPLNVEEADAVSLRGSSTSVNRSTEDSVVFLKIHWFENQNRLTLENLDHRTRCLRGGGTTHGGSSASSSHYFRYRSSNC